MALRHRQRTGRVWVLALAAVAGSAALVEAAPAPVGAAPLQPPAAAPTTARGSEGPFTTYRLPAGRRPLAVAVAPDGTVWVTLEEPRGLGALDPRTGEWREVPIPAGLRPFLPAAGQDALWFTDHDFTYNPGRGHVVRVDYATGQVTPVPVPTLDAGPAGLRVAPDGSVWFSEFLSGKVGRLAPGSAAVQEFAAGAPRDGKPPGGLGVALDGRGRVWVAESLHGRLVRLDPASGQVEGFPVPADFWSPTSLGVTPDGRLWTTSHGTSQVGAFDPETGRLVARFLTFPPDPPSPPASLPTGLVVDARGHVWVALHEAGRLARIVPETGTVVEYPLPEPRSEAQWLAVGPDGDVWYAGYAAGTVGRLRTAAALVITVRLGNAAPAGGGTVAGTLTLDSSQPLAGARLVAAYLPEGAAATFDPAAVDLAPGREVTVRYTLTLPAGSVRAPTPVLLGVDAGGLRAGATLELAPPPARAGWAVAGAAALAVVAVGAAWAWRWGARRR